MSHFTYEDRKRVYELALKKNGIDIQTTVAIEEMLEIGKEVCKMKRGKLDREHMAEEIADATIMLEQMCQMLNINDSVESWMDYKVAALKRKVER